MLDWSEPATKLSAPVQMAREAAMRGKVLAIGIGAGNPDFVTVQAVNAMNRVDVFFIPNKGIEKEELARVRHEIIERYVRDRPFRTVEYKAPVRVRLETQTERAKRRVSNMTEAA
jgi:precorrin-6A synthase